MAKSPSQKNPEKPDGIVDATELTMCPYCGKQNDSTMPWCWVCQASLHQPLPQRRDTFTTILGWIVVGVMTVVFLCAAAMIAFFCICVSVL